MRLRLILSFTLIVLVSVSSVAFIARRNTAVEVRSFMFHGGMSGLSDLASALEAYHQSHQTWQGVGNLLSSFQASPGRGMGGPDRSSMMDMMSQRLRVFDANGVLVADTSNPFTPGQLNLTDISRAIMLYNGSNLIGYLLPESGNSFSSADQVYLLNRLSRAAFSAGVISGVLALLVALLLAYSLARPLRILTEAAGQLARGDLKQRVTVHGNDELAKLGIAFNHMAASLQQAEDSRRAMTADIAHELRTPLAVQRAHLEALQDGIYPLIPENLATIQDQNLLLTRLVEDLRTLASAEAGQLTLERIPSNFPALVLRTVERFKPQAETHQIDLRLECSPDSLALPDIPLDPQRIEQILSNLLSNALRYTPDGGRIDCQVTVPDHPVLNTSPVIFTIHDSGPGIPPEALPHIFERFYRVDHSRSRTEGGSGLGLTIARRLAETHGGTLTAANHPQGGAVFSLELPVQ